MLRHRNVKRRGYLPPEKRIARAEFGNKKNKWCKNPQFYSSASGINEEATLENASESDASSDRPKPKKFKQVLTTPRLDLDNFRTVIYNNQDSSFWNQIYKYTQGEDQDNLQIKGIVEELT